MKTFLLLCSLVSSVAFAAKTETEIREAIHAVVIQRHPVVPPNFWEDLGAEALPVIKKMFSESKNPIEKSFLIDGLSHFQDAEVGNLLQAEIQAAPNDVIQKKLLSALISSQGDASYDFVEPYLKDPSPHVRAAVAKGLKQYEQNTRIRERLELFRKTEKKSWVVAEVNRGKPDEVLQRVNRPMSPQPSNAPVLKKEESKALAPLPEKQWAGTWKATVMGQNKVESVDLLLKAVDLNAQPIRWKAELNLPKKLKQEWRTGDFTVHYFQTEQFHWIELRHAKLNSVLVGMRKATKND